MAVDRPVKPVRSVLQSLNCDGRLGLALLAACALLLLPTLAGEFDTRAFTCGSGHVYLAMVKGEVGDGHSVLTRVHSECLTGDALGSLRCDCGDWLRPHVLWFDESYDEPRYRYVSALRAAETAAALIVVGTSGATTLPARMCEMVAARGAPFIVVDPEPTVFSALAEQTERGIFLRGTASEVLPSLIEELSRQQQA